MQLAVLRHCVSIVYQTRRFFVLVFFSVKFVVCPSISFILSNVARSEFPESCWRVGGGGQNETNMKNLFSANLRCVCVYVYFEVFLVLRIRYNSLNAVHGG